MQRTAPRVQHPNQGAFRFKYAQYLVSIVEAADRGLPNTVAAGACGHRLPAAPSAIVCFDEWPAVTRVKK
jgi:hypothetical protein